MLTQAQYTLLTGVVQRRSFPRGTRIIRAGEPTSSLYVIMSGRMQVVVQDGKGREVILAILRPGDFFGEMGLIDEQPRSASVVAREACELLTLAKQDLQAVLETNFDLTMTVARGLVKRLREADARIGSLALLDVYGRVAQALLHESEMVEGERIVSGHLSRIDIAKMIGASREMVTRVVKDLERRGLIEVRGTDIVLRDRLFAHSDCFL
ncbi:MAG: cyclic nucleotide-binding domain-containing protein [Burkholderiales bacterium]|nr:cyclic nucleotide-binding domain-containing protein [Burkholderiales bacterium]